MFAKDFPRRPMRRCYGASGERGIFSAGHKPMERPMPKPNDCSRSVTAFEQNSTLIAVIEMSLSSWLVAGVVPGIERHPLKKLETDEDALLKLLLRWRDEAVKAGHKIERIAIAFEAGRDGFWLERQSSICRARRHNIRHWSIESMTVPIHLLLQRRCPDPTQAGRR